MQKRDVASEFLHAFRQPLYEAVEITITRRPYARAEVDKTTPFLIGQFTALPPKPELITEMPRI